LSDALVRFDPAVRHLRCAGRDAVRFLHAVTTQDLASLRPGEGAYGALTNDRGRAIADFFAFRAADGDGVVLELPDALADPAREALERLVVADDVELRWEEGELVALAAVDEGASIALGGLADAAVRGVAATALRAPRIGLDSIALRGPRLSPELLAVRAATAEEVAWRSVAWGRPGVAEFAHANVLNELGIVHAVSFTKGCFMGQEILQRVRTQGALQQRLVGLELAATPEAEAEGAAWAGAELRGEGGAPAGVVTSAAARPAGAGGGVVALAFVRTGSDRAGTTLVARAQAAPAAPGRALEARATVTEPPFLAGAVGVEPGKDLSLVAAS
jgi:folate-binding protein YgfZ